MDYSNQENNQQLAEIFRKQRTTRGMTVEEAAGKTGIPVLHIHNIEDGKFEQFDPFYLKMYLKKYGNFLAIDLGEAYSQVYGAPKVEEAVVAIKTVKNPGPTLSSGKNNRRSEGLGKVIGMVLLVVAIGFGVYFVVDMWQEGMANREDIPIIENPLVGDMDLTGDSDEPYDDVKPEEIENVLIEESHLAATAIEMVSREGIFQSFMVNTDEEFAEIQFVFSNNTAVSPLNGMPPLEFDERTVHPVQGTRFQDGDTATITIHRGENVEVWLERLNDLEVTVNGEPVETASADGQQVLRFEIE